MMAATISSLQSEHAKSSTSFATHTSRGSTSQNGLVGFVVTRSRPAFTRERHPWSTSSLRGLHFLRFTLVESRHLDVEQLHACSDCGCELRSPSTIAASCCLRKEPATAPSQPPCLLHDSPPCLTKLASSVIVVVELELVFTVVSSSCRES